MCVFGLRDRLLLSSNQWKRAAAMMVQPRRRRKKEVEKQEGTITVAIFGLRRETREGAKICLSFSPPPLEFPPTEWNGRREERRKGF